MMFWIIIEKLWRSRPLIMTFAKAMPFGSAYVEESSRKDIWDNVWMNKNTTHKSDET